MIVNVLDAVSTPSLMIAVLWTGVPDGIWGNVRLDRQADQAAGCSQA